MLSHNHRAFPVYFVWFKITQAPQSVQLCGMRVSVDVLHFIIVCEGLGDVWKKLFPSLQSIASFKQLTNLEMEEILWLEMKQGKATVDTQSSVQQKLMYIEIYAVNSHVCLCSGSAEICILFFIFKYTTIQVV